jgi:hypothetical protein
MGNVVGVITPLIFVIALGFISTRYKLLEKPAIEAISKLTFNLLIPVFLFQHMASATLPSNINPFFFAAFYLPVLLCFAIAWLMNFIFHQQKNRLASSAVFALTASYSNTVIIGLPILMLLIGEQAVVLVFLIVTFHSAMLFTLTNVLARDEQPFQWRKFLISTFKNPLILAILLGALINGLPLQLPQVIQASLLLLGKPAITLALFVLGGSLTFYNIKADKRYVVLASSIKLIILPLVVWFFADVCFELDHITTQVLVLLSACPTGVNAYLMAVNINAHQQTAASTVLVSTLLSVITLPVWIYYLQ